MVLNLLHFSCRQGVQRNVELDDDLSLLDVVRINRELEEALGRKVDLVEYETIKPIIKERILSEEVRILAWKVVQEDLVPLKASVQGMIDGLPRT